MVRAADRKEAPEYEGMDEEDEQIKQQAAQLEEDVDDVSFYILVLKEYDYGR